MPLKLRDSPLTPWWPCDTRSCHNLVNYFLVGLKTFEGTFLCYLHFFFRLIYRASRQIVASITKLTLDVAKNRLVYAQQTWKLRGRQQRRIRLEHIKNRGRCQSYSQGASLENRNKRKQCGLIRLGNSKEMASRRETQRIVHVSRLLSVSPQWSKNQNRVPLLGYTLRKLLAHPNTSAGWDYKKSKKSSEGYIKFRTKCRI